MPNFLTQIQELDSNNKQTARSPLESRRARRGKAREAERATRRSLGAAAPLHQIIESVKDESKTGSS